MANPAQPPVPHLNLIQINFFGKTLHPVESALPSSINFGHTMDVPVEQVLLLSARFFSERSELEEGLRHCSVHCSAGRAKQCTVWPCWPPISDRSFLSLAFGLEYSLIHLSERGYNMTCEVVFQAQVETLNFHFSLLFRPKAFYVSLAVDYLFGPAKNCDFKTLKV